MRIGTRAGWYAVAGAALSLGEPIGLLIVREFYSIRPIMTELSAERVTYVYVFVTTAVVLGCLGYFIGRQADRLAMLSETDVLTGLPNRRALRQRLSGELQRATRYGSPVSLMLVDVDGLKQINDQEGHAAGDRTIRRVADAIARSLRASDLGARWGGDEFAIVMPNTATGAARRLAERLFAELSAANARAADRPITISAGIATYDPAAGEVVDTEQLATTADEALYAAKGAGKNRIQVA